MNEPKLLLVDVDDIANVESGDRLVLRRFQLRGFLVARHELLGDGIVHTVEAIANVLIGQGIVRIGWFLVAEIERSGWSRSDASDRHVPVRTFLAALALALHVERADVRLISFVVRRRASQFHQHVAGWLRLSQLTVRLRLLVERHLQQKTFPVRGKSAEKNPVPLPRRSE